jgi:hypothetical protein
LAYSGVTLAEGPWASGAYRDAYEMGRFLNTRPNPEAVSVPNPVSSGPFDPSQPQSTINGGMVVPDGMMIEQETIQAPAQPVVAPATNIQTSYVPTQGPFNPMHALPAGEAISAEPFQWTPATEFRPIHVSTPGDMRQASAPEPQ